MTRADWATTRHSFSFGEHYDPDNVAFGPVLVNNDDYVRSGAGYADHPHADAEIVTWVLSGSLVHADSTGHRGIVYPGLAQRMSAGSRSRALGAQRRLRGRPGSAARAGALRADVAATGRVRWTAQLRPTGGVTRRPGSRLGAGRFGPGAGGRDRSSAAPGRHCGSPRLGPEHAAAADRRTRPTPFSGRRRDRRRVRRPPGHRGRAAHHRQGRSAITGRSPAELLVWTMS